MGLEDEDHLGTARVGQPGLTLGQCSGRVTDPQVCPVLGCALVTNDPTRDVVHGHLATAGHVILGSALRQAGQTCLAVIGAVGSDQPQGHGVTGLETAGVEAHGRAVVGAHQAGRPDDVGWGGRCRDPWAPAWSSSPLCVRALQRSAPGCQDAAGAGSRIRAGRRGVRCAAGGPPWILQCQAAAYQRRHRRKGRPRPPTGSGADGRCLPSPVTPPRGARSAAPRWSTPANPVPSLASTHRGDPHGDWDIPAPYGL